CALPIWKSSICWHRRLCKKLPKKLKKRVPHSKAKPHKKPLRKFLWTSKLAILSSSRKVHSSLCLLRSLRLRSTPSNWSCWSRSLNAKLQLPLASTRYPRSNNHIYDFIIGPKALFGPIMSRSPRHGDRLVSHAPVVGAIRGRKGPKNGPKEKGRRSD